MMRIRLGPLLGLVAAHVSAAIPVSGACVQEPPVSKPPIIRLVCPVPKAHVESEMHAVTIRVNGIAVYACNDVSLKMFKKDPAAFIEGEMKDPVTGKPFKVTNETPKVVRGGNLFLFSSPATKAEFLKDPKRYLKPPPK